MTTKQPNGFLHGFSPFYLIRRSEHFAGILRRKLRGECFDINGNLVERLVELLGENPVFFFSSNCG